MQELKRHTHLPRVKEDLQSGVESGVTPEFFINGVIHSGDYNLPWLRKAIERTGQM